MQNKEKERSRETNQSGVGGSLEEVTSGRPRIKRREHFVRSLIPYFAGPFARPARSFPFFSKSLKSFDNDTRLRRFEG